MLDFAGLHGFAHAVHYSFSWHVNESSMRQKIAVHKIMSGEIPPIHQEKYADEYACADVNGKVVLDLGADVGSTAQFFIKRLAKQVIAVEGSGACFPLLCANSGKIGNVTPVKLFISSPAQVASLLRNWKPDVVKCDIEGGEVHLFNISDTQFQSVSDYIIEVHSPFLFAKLKTKCTACGFALSIVYVDPLGEGNICVVYAQRL